MTEVNFEIKGLKELAKNRSKLSKSLEKTMLRTALRNAAKPVKKLTEENIRRQGLVESGELVRGIDINAKVTRRGTGWVHIGYKPDQFYGGFHELGTSQVPAKPHLRPAIQQARDNGDIEEAFIGALNKSIARQLKKLRG